MVTETGTREGACHRAVPHAGPRGLQRRRRGGLGARRAARGAGTARATGHPQRAVSRLLSSATATPRTRRRRESFASVRSASCPRHATPGARSAIVATTPSAKPPSTRSSRVRGRRDAERDEYCQRAPGSARAAACRSGRRRSAWPRAVTASHVDDAAVVRTATATRDPRDAGLRRHASTAASDEWHRDREAQREGKRCRQREAREPVGQLLEHIEDGEARLRATPERIAVDVDVARPPEGGNGDQRDANAPTRARRDGQNSPSRASAASTIAGSTKTPEWRVSRSAQARSDDADEHAARRGRRGLGPDPSVEREEPRRGSRRRAAPTRRARRFGASRTRRRPRARRRPRRVRGSRPRERGSPRRERAPASRARSRRAPRPVRRQPDRDERRERRRVAGREQRDQPGARLEPAALRRAAPPRSGSSPSRA